jgi:uncharacterized protein
MRPVIIVFAKAPGTGRVKTRLIPAVSPAYAAELHSAFVRDTLANLITGSVADVADIELHTDTPTDAWAEFGVPRRVQHEGDLGLRMFHALTDALAAGRPRAMILGSDAPDLPPSHISQLLASTADVALGPAGDGGYYAIAAGHTHEAMFQAVEWSGPHALAGTVQACESTGLTVEIGRYWNDIDTPADLERLMDSERAPESRAVLRAAGVRGKSTTSAIQHRI